MKAAIIAVLLVISVITVHSSPLYQYEDNFVEFEPEDEGFVRQRRSPERGRLEFDFNDERDEHGRRDKHAEAAYKQRWGREDGPQFEVDGYYRRNFVPNQPREAHGARAKITIPIGEH